MEGEICSEEEWEVVDYYHCNDEDLCAKLQEEEEEKEKWWWRWWSGVGKKVVVTGVVISSAPVVIPPLLVVSALGFVVSLPFGVAFASYAATNKLMAKLLPPPPPPYRIPEEDYYDDEGFAINNGVEMKNHIHEEEENDDDEVEVAISNAVEIPNHIHEKEEEDEEVVAIQNHIQEEEDVAINNAVEIQNDIHEEEKIDGNIETSYESMDNGTSVNHLPHPESSCENDNAGIDEEKSSKSGDQKLDMEIKQLGRILMSGDDTPLQKHDEVSKDAVIIQVHHHTETVGGPGQAPLKTAEIDVTTVVVAGEELKEEKQSRQVNGGGLHSDRENMSDEKIWEKINAIRVIVGFKAPKRRSCVEELKALYLYTGIEPPVSPSVADKLSFLMSVIGLK